MNILYVSCLCSDKIFSNVFSDSKVKPLQSIQKFHKLLIEGMCESNVNITILSQMPVHHLSHFYYKPKKEKRPKLIFYYIPFIRIPGLKALIDIIYTIYAVIRWASTTSRKEDKAIVCDIFSYWPSVVALFLSKLLCIKTCVILTDLPQMIASMDLDSKRSFIASWVETIGARCIKWFDAYILVTRQMNEVINPENKPYMIMEGMVDVKMKELREKKIKYGNSFTILYSGGLYEKYGIGKLIKAFEYIENDNIILELYGNGEFVQELNDICKKERRVRYLGILPNNEMVKRQKEVDLLVNPRNSNEEFTKYSFPFKNMEYMVSGTPLLTTHLPGMPDEYLDYVYIIEQETPDGIANCIKKIIADKERAVEVGRDAQRFVLENKNNIIQGKRVIDFIKFLLK